MNVKTRSGRVVVCAMLAGAVALGSGCTEADEPVAPAAAFAAEPTWGQSSLPVRFTDVSVAGTAEIVERRWDFGDGSTSTEAAPTHVYASPGTYTVTLAVTTAAGSSTATLADHIVVTANDVLAWNEVALKLVAAGSLMPPQAARALAMLHAAMYDAVNAVERTGQVYVADVVAPAGAHREAAAAQAAHGVLSQLFPDHADVIDAQLAVSLGAVPDGEGKTAGAALGQSVAAAILAWRAGDGAEAMVMSPYLGGDDAGEWRPTPPAYTPGMFSHWGAVKPFALSAPDQFQPDPPPALDSAAYAADWLETKTLGAKESAARTMDQSMQATFWVGMPGTVMEAGRMNQVAQQAAAANGLTLAQAARLFTLVNLALADAAIAGVHCKYHYSTWRPVTAIREADVDGNPDTVADTTWEPLLAAPAHPEYISTHSALTKAAAVVLAQFFGEDHAHLSLPGFMDPGMTREYTSFSQVAEEAGLSRIYGGIHFRFSYDAGSLLGQRIGEHVAANFLQPR